MVVKFFRDNRIKYATRKRYININIEPFNTETYKSIVLGNGAETTLKTSSDNICDYVTIDDTRWFVTSYVYLNGKQVVLNLQRDVIGEFGINECFGKIERGYTDSILKYRKELSLNQILKKRIKIVPDKLDYGGWNVNTHDDEKWGILYIAKPYTDEQKININIPSFSPQPSDLPFVSKNPSMRTTGFKEGNISVEFYVKFINNKNTIIGAVDITFNVYLSQGFTVSVKEIKATNPDKYYPVTYKIDTDMDNSNYVFNLIEYGKTIGTSCAVLTLSNFQNNIEDGFEFPDDTAHYNDNIPNENYDGLIVKNDNKFYLYKDEKVNLNVYGTIWQDFNSFYSNILSKVKTFSKDNFVFSLYYFRVDNEAFYNADCYIIENVRKLTYKQLTAEESGTMEFNVANNFIDEPYYITVIPLYDVTITNGISTYNISKTRAFEIFNTVIQNLSGGENPYLVDAQIFPYCPNISSVNTELEGYPIFNLSSTSFERICTLYPYPFSDIKKDYICRELSIVSPEKSNKFTFNYYDYVKTVDDENGINKSPLVVKIKNSLKPFAIISSVVIDRDTTYINDKESPLAGITYGSDLNGCQPAGNGFECSLASNAFETYKRQNSNYQQLFNLEKEELQKQHSVELVNESVSTVMNTITAASFGAIAGGAMSDISVAGTNVSKAAGAIAGGAVAGATAGAAMITQTVENQKLREYEEYLQQERFNLNIGTIKNLPSSINRISSFNEIIMKDFYFALEIYECSNYEIDAVDRFISNYGYGIGIYDFISNYVREDWFIRADLITSRLNLNLHMIAKKELAGGIYINEQI